MRYVATRPLRECLPTGEVVTHEMGAELTRFAQWNYAVQAALLRRQDVVEAPDDPDAAPEPQPAPKTAPAAAGAAAPASAEADGPAWSCPRCPGKTFASQQGLRLHTTRIHRGRA